MISFLACSAALLRLGYGCSAAQNDLADVPVNPGVGGMVEAGLDDVVLRGDSQSDEDGALRLNALCGPAPRCVPDDTASCLHFSPGAGGMASEGGASAGAAGTTSQGGQSPSVAGASGESGSAGDRGGEGGSGARPATNAVYGCQIQRDEVSASGVISACSPIGRGGNNAPCITSSDCQVGFGCVADHGSGLCQRYCCRDGDSCEPDTYCAERPLRDALTNAEGETPTVPVLIPVCAAAENCDLRTPYPCPAGMSCTCQTGSACVVVRSDGTTTCTKPGKGKAGEACPCAWNHVCSAATNQCVELCYTSDRAACGKGKCQSAAELPAGFGVCVGG